ncbi:MAG: metalloregulator ArsR/SmtB family transcription factor [Acidaminococcaceae bacterium]|nr:metalloregulator ArsR/SmtB family transcription factor [Acidaminococcaceae bacterium]MDD4721613.1 metalloregulator ArsR/SmtB family transcription factor [Acidaminococcaceae bacterium]
MPDIDYVLIFKALGDDKRLKIVQMLSDEEKCACKLLEEFIITQPTLSHHMKILCDCGLVDVRRDGKWSHYSLNGEVLGNLKKFVNKLNDGKDGGALCK